MAASTAIVAGAVIAGGATVYASNQASKSADKQLQQAEQARRDMLKSQIKPEQADSMAQAKQDRQRKQALAAYGRSDTLLTGSQGLGDGTIPASEAPGKATLLGQ